MGLKIRVLQWWPIDKGPEHSNYSLTVQPEGGATAVEDFVSVSIENYSAEFLIKNHKLVAEPERESTIALPGYIFKGYSQQ